MLVLAKKLHSSFLQKIIELHIALKINNIGWAKKIISQIIRIDPHELIFRIQPYAYKNKKQVEKMATVVRNLLVSTKPLLKNKLLYRLFESRIKSILDPSTKGSWSLADIREIVEGNTPQSLHFDVWIKELLLRTSKSEVARFLEKKLNKKYIRQMDASRIWVFNYYYPKDLTLRNFIIDKIYKTYQRQDSYLKYLVLKLLSNPVIKKAMAEKDPFFNKALFQIKRSVYRRFLSQGEAVHFSLYNLMQLGDKAL